MRRVLALMALLLPALAAHAEPTPRGPQVGEVFEIRREAKASSESNDGGSRSSFDRDTLTERVIGVRESGLELEYDLPTGTTADDRDRQWQLPVRVFKPVVGPIELLNSAELQARADAWLRAADLTRDACGRWYFTWNAFRIDCDPQGVLETLEVFDLRPSDLHDGAPYQAPRSTGPAPLKRTASSPQGATFAVEATLDPEVLRRELAEADVVMAEITRKSLTLEAALRVRSAEAVSGTITITLETDPTGVVQRRTTITVIEITEADGKRETRTVTETVERRTLSSSPRVARSRE